MREIQSIQELKAIMEQLERLLQHPGPYPLFNLQERPASYWFVEFDYPFTDEFFDLLRKFAKDVGDKSFSFVTLSPHPLDVYYKNFGWFAACTFSIDDPISSFDEFLLKGTEEQQCDAIAYLVDCFAMISSSGSWVVYGTRESGLTVLATFNGERTSDRFRPPYFMSAETAVEFIEELGILGIDVNAFKRSWLTGKKGDSI